MKPLTHFRPLSLFIALPLAAALSAGLHEADAYVDPTSGEPLPNRVLRGFDPPEQKWLAGHRGVDLDLNVGEEVLAAGSGVIAFAGSVAGTPTISIDHPDGIRTTYQPVHARVSRGDMVFEGDVIGTLGHPFDGYPGLHWGARVDKDDYIDPLELLDAPIIRLKPLDAA